MSRYTKCRYVGIKLVLMSRKPYVTESSGKSVRMEKCTFNKYEDIYTSEM
jgi:hypothetical protein